MFLSILISQSSKTLYKGRMQSQIQFIVPANIGETIIKESIKTTKLEKQRGTLLLIKHRCF